MSKRVFAVAVLCLLVLLVACESKTTGKRVAIPEATSKSSVTGAIASTPQTPTGETGKSAAEALKELQATGTTTPSGEKSGSFYPPVITDATGKDALAAKTRALMTQGTYDPKTDAIGDFGAKYHEKDGDPTNLPEGYSNNQGD